MPSSKPWNILTIQEIAERSAPNNWEAQKRVVIELVDAAHLKLLPYRGKEPPRRVSSKKADFGETFEAYGGKTYILRDDYFAYLKDQYKPLPDWWPTPNGVIESPPSKQANLELQPLLKTAQPVYRKRKPLQQSDLSVVIDKAIDALEEKNNRTPEFVEVWSYLTKKCDTTGIIVEVKFPNKKEGYILKTYDHNVVTREAAQKSFDNRFLK